MKNHLKRISKEITQRQDHIFAQHTIVYFVYFHWDGSDITTSENEHNSLKYYKRTSNSDERDYMFLVYNTRAECLERLNNYLGNATMLRKEVGIVGSCSAAGYGIEVIKEVKAYSPDNNIRYFSYE